jgi:hypothetical protein
VVRVAEAQALSGDALASVLTEVERLAGVGESQALINLLAANLPGNQLGQAPPPEITSVV